MEEYQSYFDANKTLWDKRTAVHKDSAFYDLAGFRAGKDVLTPIERDELGDVQGKSMLHLQCHFGMDSLNWSRLGAKVTGVDLSDAGIREAIKLNEEMGLNANFLCCNIYDLSPENIPKHLPANFPQPGSFDIVFTSYGVVGWLPDLERWAAIIAYYLKPGGIFYIAEFHPVMWMFDDEFTKIQYAYDNREIIVTENLSTYTDRESVILGKEYSWNHSLSEVGSALLNHGLRIELFHEFMYSPYPCFRQSVETEKGRWCIKGMEGKLPMVYSIRAVKQKSNPLSSQRNL